MLPLFVQYGVIECDRGIVCKRAEKGQLVLRIESQTGLMPEVHKADKSSLVDEGQTNLGVHLCQSLDQGGGQSVTLFLDALLKFFLDDRLVAIQEKSGKALIVRERNGIGLGF